MAEIKTLKVVEKDVSRGDHIKKYFHPPTYRKNQISNSDNLKY